MNIKIPERVPLGILEDLRVDCSALPMNDTEVIDMTVGATNISSRLTFESENGNTKHGADTTPPCLWDSVHDLKHYTITEGFIDGNVNPSIIGDNQDVDPYDFNYHGVPKQHRVLKEQPPCPLCGAKRIKFEFPTFCFIKGKTELCARRLVWPNLDRQIVEILTRVLATNPYVTTFRSLADLGPLDDYRVVDIWIEGNNNISAYKRDIVVYGRSDYPTQIQPHFASYDPLSYVLFFPKGEPGWHSKIPRVGVSIDEIIGDEENMEEDYEGLTEPGGRKTVTCWACTTFTKIVTSCLLFIERNQTKIRADLYQGIMDCVNAGKVQPRRLGQIVVLLASFIGGPHDMRRRFLDAMTLVQDEGKPDIFLTMTCNPNWPEIQMSYLPGQADSRSTRTLFQGCSGLELRI
ncbi:uncharacterized protein Tco_0270230 [Tanacetum coccineum]